MLKDFVIFLFTEHVHSQGIVLEDRSVQYKYLNPNLIAVLTEGEEPQQKGFSSLHLSFFHLTFNISCENGLFEI